MQENNSRGCQLRGLHSGAAAGNPTIRNNFREGRCCGWGQRPQAPAATRNGAAAPLPRRGLCAASATRRIISVTSHRSEKQLLSVLTKHQSELARFAGIGAAPHARSAGVIGGSPPLRVAPFHGKFSGNETPTALAVWVPRSEHPRLTTAYSRDGSRQRD